MSLERAGRRVVVSPHLDDAVLSCSGWAQQARPTVVTVFAGVPPQGTPAPTWDRMTRASDPHSRLLERRAEDDAALDLLGLDTRRLDHLDGQYRDRPVDPTELVASVRPLLAGAEEIWAPAGLGHHVDHLAARDAAIAVALEAGAALTLYADIPYVLVYGWPTWVDGMTPQPPYDAGAWVDAEMSNAGLELTALTPRPLCLDGAMLSRKLRAMACYASQLPILDAQSGFRLSDPAVIRYEVAWDVADGCSPIQSTWTPGAARGYLPGKP